MPGSYVMGIDPGTLKTGYAIIHVADDSTEVVASGLIPVNKKEKPALRVNSIVNQVVSLIAGEHRVSSLWVELFVSYGGRSGMMWNSALAGALCYIPVTRHDNELTAYGVFPIQWRSWVKEVVGAKEITLSAIEKLLHSYDIKHDKEILKDPHMRDAVGIAVFGLHGADLYEHKTSSTIN